MPEADTDMIAVSIARYLGFIGIATLAIFYLLIARRGLKIASLVEGPAALLAAGATHICGQAGLNLLVTSGVLPVRDPSAFCELWL
ncbi:MAG: FtsW/RodA/SpoVE family cell cycle protein [Deinococcales bacterium]